MRWLLKNRHLALASTWGLLAVPTVLWWKDSVLWVAILSLYANLASEIAAHHALRAEKEVSDG